MKQIATPTLTQRDLRKCCCCVPAKRTLVTGDENGCEQYTCPVTKVTMRWSEGAQTYLQGRIILP